ncbi:hypothetical protein AMAG_20155 [Allomyces macrogynus ATCC 38327]|uniref:Cyclic nucleotide-binding domain-containing protein n=1 Tax=Allomyces macrogynus (strain ATCC 38327) TaxID=578462 RepID=A0A0L0T5I8_ALLM3|nr:hypothetical protein AMAG_20155 [Allomyces macrogynus ATCC 38327]|eukprot:KNE70000.1 hypothetical protein AMAG_20155 [Allomyces macrogynus ATCC 38327]
MHAAGTIRHGGSPLRIVSSIASSSSSSSALSSPTPSATNSMHTLSSVLSNSSVSSMAPMHLNEINTETLPRTRQLPARAHSTTIQTAPPPPQGAGIARTTSARSRLTLGACSEHNVGASGPQLPCTTGGERLDPYPDTSSLKSMYSLAQSNPLDESSATISINSAAMSLGSQHSPSLSRQSPSQSTVPIPPASPAVPSHERGSPTPSRRSQTVSLTVAKPGPRSALPHESLHQLTKRPPQPSAVESIAGDDFDSCCDADGDTESATIHLPPAPLDCFFLRKLLNWLMRTAILWSDALATADNDPDSPFWSAWDAFLRLLDLYYLVLIPPLLAFMCDYTFDFAHSFVGFDAALTLSILVEFVRPRRDKYGDLVIDRRQMMTLFFSQRRNQLRFISVIPLDWLVLAYHDRSGMACRNPIYVYSDGQLAQVPRVNLSNGVALLGKRFMYYPEDIPWPLIIYALLHSLRILHIFPTVLWMLKTHIPNVPQPISRLIKILSFLLILGHINSCLYWAMDIRLDHTMRNVNEHLVDAHQVPTSFSARYAQNFLDGVRAFFFITRNVSLIPEIMYTTCELLLASVMYGLIITNLAAIVRSFDNQAEFDEMAKNRNFKRTMMRQHMVKHKFPRELQKKIIDQEEFEWVQKQGVDLDNLFRDLPVSLRQEAAVHLYYDLINAVPLFHDAEESFKVALADRINKITVQAGFYICRAGDPGKEMYFIRSGMVHILTADESKLIVTLNPASFFGELALLEPSSRRTATAKAVVETDLCVLRKDEFNQILADHPDMVGVFQRAAAERREADAKRKAAEAQELEKAQERDKANRASLASMISSAGSRKGFFRALGAAKTVMARGMSPLVSSEAMLSMTSLRLVSGGGSLFRTLKAMAPTAAAPSAAREGNDETGEQGAPPVASAPPMAAMPVAERIRSVSSHSSRQRRASLGLRLSAIWHGSSSGSSASLSPRARTASPAAHGADLEQGRCVPPALSESASLVSVRRGSEKPTASTATGGQS